MVIINFVIFQWRKSLPVTWLSLGEWYSRERAILPLSIYEVKFLGQFKLRVLTTENIYSTCVIYDP